jgi:hypothetical protein
MHRTGVPEADQAAVREIVVGELRTLETYNCARFGLTPGPSSAG